MGECHCSSVLQQRVIFNMNSGSSPIFKTIKADYGGMVLRLAQFYSYLHQECYLSSAYHPLVADQKIKGDMS